MTTNTDPKATGTSQTECGVCGYNNRPGLLACENCGSLLVVNSKTRQATRDLVKDGGSLDSIVDDEEDEVVPINTSEYQKGMTVRLLVEGKDGISSPVEITPQQLEAQVVIGRHDPITQTSPPVDLDTYAAYRNGVSRKHCTLQIINDSLMVSDLGSSNGTFLNDIRLPMRRPHTIVDGDKLRVGQVNIVVEFARVD